MLAHVAQAVPVVVVRFVVVVVSWLPASAIWYEPFDPVPGMVTVYALPFFTGSVIVVDRYGVVNTAKLAYAPPLSTEYSSSAVASCFWLPSQAAVTDSARACRKFGIKMAASIAMIAITIISSMSVKPFSFDRIALVIYTVTCPRLYNCPLCCLLDRKKRPLYIASAWS